jgi:hypothetical protein
LILALALFTFLVNQLHLAKTTIAQVKGGFVKCTLDGFQHLLA